MNANAAAELTKKNLKGKVIQPHLEYIFGKVVDCAEEGKSEWYIRFENLLWPTPEQREAIYSKLRELNYTIVHHEDPDPQDPRSSGAYDTLEW